MFFLVMMAQDLYHDCRLQCPMLSIQELAVTTLYTCILPKIFVDIFAKNIQVQIV